jgi:hypothetical protein
MNNKFNYDVDIDSNMLLLKLKQVIDEYKNIDRKIIHTKNFIKNYEPVDYSERDWVYDIKDTTIEGQQKILDRYIKRKDELHEELNNISKILNHLIDD